MSQNPQLTAHPRIPDGTILNQRYKLTGFLGAGGHATVYRAFDLTIEREVAVKVLLLLSQDHTTREHTTQLNRFRAEARLAARIEHPNVVSIYDMGVIAEVGFPFIVMAYLRGHDLRTELHYNGPLRPARALQLTIQCLDALQCGHEQDIIHRDLKPSNIILVNPGTDRESPRILDFGIARHLTGAHLTGAGQLLGTPRYLAPEYIMEQRVSPALDVYQMGLILAEMLMGRSAIVDRPSMDCITQHTHGLLDIDPQLLGSPLGPVLRRATALRPSERFGSALAFRQALLSINPDAIPALTQPAEARAEEAEAHLSIDIDLSQFNALPNSSSSARRQARAPHLAAPPPKLEPTIALPAPPSGSVRPWLLLGGAAALAVALIAVAWFTVQPPAQGRGSTQVELRSVPPAATVRDGAVILGSTPLTVPIQGEARRVRVEHEGFQPVEVELWGEEPARTVVLPEQTARN